MGTILSETYQCDICGKKCRTDKLGYQQGMYLLWKYGSHSDIVDKDNVPARGNICSPCLNAIIRTIRKIQKTQECKK